MTYRTVLAGVAYKGRVENANRAIFQLTNGILVYCTPAKRKPRMIISPFTLANHDPYSRLVRPERLSDETVSALAANLDLLTDADIAKFQARYTEAEIARGASEFSQIRLF